MKHQTEDKTITLAYNTVIIQVVVICLTGAHRPDQ